MLSELFIPKYSLNIDRASLPQVKTSDLFNYFQYLKHQNHITFLQTKVPANKLTASQGNFNTSKVEHFLSQDRKDDTPLLISNDFIVMDGHHRWLAQLNTDPHALVSVYKASANILDLIAATRAYPKSFTKNVVESFRALTEAAEKHSVLAFGRMNPPTAGHAKLVHKVHEVAQEHHADHHVVLSHSHDSEKNPLSPGDKLKHAKHAFPGTHLSLSSKEHPTIFHHAALLHKAGTKHLHVVVGSDRVKDFHTNLHKYNGHFDKEGHGYKFKSITVHSAGHRDPDAKGVEGMSASKMREHAKAGNFHHFKQGVAPTVSHAHAKELYDDVRKGQTVNEDYMDQMPEKRGKFPVSYTKKPNPKCKVCDGTGYETKYHSWGTHSQSPCVCTQLKESVDYLTEHVHDAGIFKAIHLAGAPGSGKDFVLKKALQGHGLTEVDADTALKHLSDHKDSKGPSSSKAKSIKELRQRLALHGRNGLIINHSSANAAQTKKIKDMLEDLGYENKMVFVDAADNVSRNRNVERGQSGGRMIPEKQRAEKWRKAQDARVDLSKMFGGEHYHEFNNDEDMRNNTDPEIQGQKTSELEDLHKTVKKFAQQPPKSDAAQEWVYKNINKLSKTPIGNKKQQSAQIPSSAENQTSEDAKKLGLTYYGKGRYGKSGRVSHFSVNGKLIEKKKALTLPKAMKDKEKEHDASKKKKSVNEEFESFLLEDTDESIYLRDHMEYTVLADEDRGMVLPLQHLTDTLPMATWSPDPVCESGESEGRTGSDDDGYSYPDLGAYVSATQRAFQEEKESQEKVSFGAFRQRLVVPGIQAQEKETLNEGEPVVDDMAGSGGPILGGPPAESPDTTNGGKATSGPKKTLKQLRGGIK